MNAASHEVSQVTRLPPWPDKIQPRYVGWSTGVKGVSISLLIKKLTSYTTRSNETFVIPEYAIKI